MLDGERKDLRSQLQSAEQELAELRQAHSLEVDSSRARQEEMERKVCDVRTYVIYKSWLCSVFRVYTTQTEARGSLRYALSQIHQVAMIHIIYMVIRRHFQQSDVYVSPFFAKWCLCDTIFCKVVFM